MYCLNEQQFQKLTEISNEYTGLLAACIIMGLILGLTYFFILIHLIKWVIQTNNRINKKRINTKPLKRSIKR